MGVCQILRTFLGMVTRWTCCIVGVFETPPYCFFVDFVVLLFSPSCFERFLFDSEKTSGKDTVKG